MLGNRPRVTKVLNILVKLLPLIAFIVPVFMLYSLDPAVFEKTWKGRIFYVFFLWLISLELILNWEKLQTKLKKIASARTGVLVVALLLPAFYVVASNFYGLNAVIEDVAKENGVLWASVMPLSTEYIVFTVCFVLIVLLEYGARGIKNFAVSTFFLGLIGMIYTIDNVYPDGQFTPFQMIVPTTATLAANVLNMMGYHTSWLPPQNGMPILHVQDSAGVSTSVAIAWACSGVESLLIYTVTVLLFLKNSVMSWKQRAIYFMFGAIVTYFINILRIVTITTIAMYGTIDDFMAFHDYYGQLYSITWIICYPLLIIGSQALWGKIQNWKIREKEPTSTSQLQPFQPKPA